jgi:hypothetical protein
MFPTGTGNAYVVNTLAGITSWQNGIGSPTTDYKSVVWVDSISRLMLIQNESTQTAWYILWISWVVITFAWTETWTLSFDTLEYKVSNYGGDKIAVLWYVLNGQTS